MSLTAIMFWISYVCGTCAAVFNPIAGVLLYILVYHLNPETQWWGQSVRALGIRTSFTVALAAGVGLLVRRPRLEHGAQQFPLPYALALLLGIVAVGSLTWGFEPCDRGHYQAWKYVKLMIFLFILIRCVRKPLHYHLVILAWLVGVAYLGYQASGGVGRMHSGRLAYGIGGPDFAESSGLAVHLVATLPLIGAWFFMARSWWGRTFALVTGALAVNTIIMTRTRNAIVGLALMAIAAVLSLPRGFRMKGLAAVLAGAFLAVHLTDPGWWKRMETVLHYEQDSGAVQRLTLWNAAFHMALDHPFGIGLGNFRQVVVDYLPELPKGRSAHNTLATCIAELGWPGIILILAIIVVTLTRLGRVRRVARQLPAFVEIPVHRWQPRFHLGWHAVALRAGLIGYCGCAVFTTRLFAEDLWMLIGFAMCLRNVSLHMEAQNELADLPEPYPTPSLIPASPATPANVIGKISHASQTR